MLGKIVEKRKTYLNIKDGAVIKKTQSGEEKYSFVDGILDSITLKERIFKNDIAYYWYVDIRDVESGELYSLSFPFSSNIFKSLILSLASEDGLEAIRRASAIRIEPYSKNGYNKVMVWGDGMKLSWIAKKLPPIKIKKVGERIIRDDSKRMDFIISLTKRIISNLIIK